MAIDLVICREKPADVVHATGLAALRRTRPSASRTRPTDSKASAVRTAIGMPHGPAVRELGLSRDYSRFVSPLKPPGTRAVWLSAEPARRAAHDTGSDACLAPSRRTTQARSVQSCRSALGWVSITVGLRSSNDYVMIVASCVGSALPRCVGRANVAHPGWASAANSRSDRALDPREPHTDLVDGTEAVEHLLRLLE